MTDAKFSTLCESIFLVTSEDQILRLYNLKLMYIMYIILKLCMQICAAFQGYWLGYHIFVLSINLRL